MRTGKNGSNSRAIDKLRKLGFVYLRKRERESKKREKNRIKTTE